MTSFFDDLRNPQKPAGPVDLGDLRREVDQLTGSLADEWNTSIFASQRRGSLHALLTERVYDHACAVAGTKPPASTATKLCALIVDILQAEPLLRWRPTGGVGLAYKALLEERAQLLKIRSLLRAPDVPLDLLCETIGGVFGLILKGLPSGSETGIAFETRVLDLKTDIPQTVDSIVSWLMTQRDDLTKHGMLPTWTAQLMRNVLRVAGLTDKATEREFDQRYRKAVEQRNATPQQLIDTYLAGFPFVRAFEFPWAFHL